MVCAYLPSASALFAVGRILHPRATELLDDTGQRRKGQNPASAKEVREV